MNQTIPISRTSTASIGRRKQLPKRILLLSLVLLLSNLFANSDYQSMCAACHGKSGEGNPALSAPSLASLDASYLQRQLIHFKSGIRGNHKDDDPGQQMSAFARALTDEQIAAIANYLSKLPASRPEATLTGNSTQGKKVYSSNCAACHGGDGAGNPGLNAPSLLTQHNEYLLRQLSNFKRGVRGAHPADKYGRQMAMMAALIPDEQTMKDVIAYLNSLSTQK
jgi:cytochrome c553